MDVRVDKAGGIVGLTGMTAAGRDFLAEQCQSEPWQWTGLTLNVDSRYAAELIDGMEADGLVVSN